MASREIPSNVFRSVVCAGALVTLGEPGLELTRNIAIFLRCETSSFIPFAYPTFGIPLRRTGHVCQRPCAVAS